MPTPGVEPRFYTLEDVATILNVRVDRVQLDAYIERMHEQTADWARKHPLIGAPEES
jgi:hypothetical protein